MTIFENRLVSSAININSVISAVLTISFIKTTIVRDLKLKLAEHDM